MFTYKREPVGLRITKPGGKQLNENCKCFYKDGKTYIMNVELVFKFIGYTYSNNGRSKYSIRGFGKTHTIHIVKGSDAFEKNNYILLSDLILALEKDFDFKWSGKCWSNNPKRASVVLKTKGSGGVTSLNSTGYNMIANMERNLNLIEYDKKTGLITSIPTTPTDVGYGHDYIKNPLPSLPSSVSASEAYALLMQDAEAYERAIASINASFAQDQFNALIALRYNVGSLGVIDGLLEYLENGSYERFKLKNLVNSYYDAIIKSNSANEKYRDGWYNRTEKMLDIFFEGNYGSMPIDAVNGRVVK